MKDLRIIYADAEQNNLNAFIAYFRRTEFDIITCLNSEELLEEVSATVSHLIIIDQKILEEIGFDFLQKVKINSIAVTASRDTSFVELAVSKGKIKAYHTKPYNMESLNQSIELFINRNRI